MSSTNYQFSIGIMENLNGHVIKALVPDADGFYTTVVGCIGVPTRAGVIYDPPSFIEAMTNPSSRFNICLKDGNLSGEWGHPDVFTKEDIPRLFKIDEDRISHFFGKIWTGTDNVMINGMEAKPILAKVKPIGPRAGIAKQMLEDKHHNTSFSLRALCTPISGPDKRYTYRQVNTMVTFDMVYAPGYDITSKRYAPATESLSMDVTEEDLRYTVSSSEGMESSLMITEEDINRLYKPNPVYHNGEIIAKSIVGNKSFIDENNIVKDAASLMYSRRR